MIHRQQFKDEVIIPLEANYSYWYEKPQDKTDMWEHVYIKIAPFTLDEIIQAVRTVIHKGERPDKMLPALLGAMPREPDPSFKSYSYKESVIKEEDRVTHEDFAKAFSWIKE